MKDIFNITSNAELDAANRCEAPRESCRTLCRQFAMIRKYNYKERLDWRFRVNIELNELSGKISALGNLFGTAEFLKLRKFQRTLLGIQFDAMKTYRDCLEERLNEEECDE
ncbi:hypothetical protein FACS1894200_10490 [Spirochaetia bacterium]|nr:hypothetical protein FACS1894200_10490 [Spirochaetia bacterium]